MLIEKYAGAMPLWIAPEQARILPISTRHVDAAQELAAKLRLHGLRVDLDLRDEKIGKKIREAQMDKLHYMLILGDQEIEQNTISVRSRLDGELGSMTVEALAGRMKEEIASRRHA